MAGIHYTVTDLGVLPGFVGSSATAINDRGQIIGSLRMDADDDGDSHAFWWEGGRMHRVGKVSLNGINNQGQAVGTKLKRGRGFLSLYAVSFRDGKVEPLFANNLLISSAEAINENSQVVGYVATPLNKIKTAADVKYDGFIWQDGERRDLPLPPGCYGSPAVAINDAGTIVGTAKRTQQDGPTLEQAVLWEGNVVTLLGLLPGFEESQAVAINNRRQVLVQAFSSPHQEDELGRSISTRYFLWHDDQAQEIPGRSARALNDQGQVVGSDGWLDSDTGRGLWAFLWQDGKMTDLNSLIPPNSDWELTYAEGINNHGQIVGSGVYHDQERAFLLTLVAH